MRVYDCGMSPPSRNQDEGFYAAVKAFERFEDVADARVYTRVPDSWHVLMTDVQGSTKAIEAGRYKDVNALGVSTIIAVVNQLSDISFPYVFGGDGATLLIPPSRRAEAEHAARSAIAMARDAFNLELRAAILPIADLTAAGAEVRAAKYQVSPNVALAMLEGSGLSLAESMLKNPPPDRKYLLQSATTPDLSLFQGFQCRWRPIPSRKDHIVSLMASATTADPASQRVVYRRILSGITSAAHRGMADLHPITPDGLSLSTSPQDLRVEGAVRSGQPQGWSFDLYATRARLVARLGRFLMGHRVRLGGFDGAQHGHQVAANTDFRKFDGTLRMVLDVSKSELDSILKNLQAERKAGQAVYGLHVSDSALMTCFIQDFSRNHIHFVDGSNGGYAQAAKQLKEQLQNRKESESISCAI